MKGISRMVWIAITLFVAAVAIGLIVYWFFGWGGQTGAELTRAECTMKKQRACESWAAAGYPAVRQYDRVACSYGRPMTCCNILPSPNAGIPQACGDQPANRFWYISGYHLVATAGGCGWFDCIAPGCAEKFDMKLENKGDCGAE